MLTWRCWFSPVRLAGSQCTTASFPHSLVHHAVPTVATEVHCSPYGTAYPVGTAPQSLPGLPSEPHLLFLNSFPPSPASGLVLLHVPQLLLQYLLLILTYSLPGLQIWSLLSLDHETFFNISWQSRSVRNKFFHFFNLSRNMFCLYFWKLFLLDIEF